MVAAVVRRRCPWVVTCVLVRDDVATKRGYPSCVWVMTWQRDVVAQPTSTYVCIHGDRATLCLLRTQWKRRSWCCRRSRVE